MNLIKSSMFSGISTIIRVATAFIINKVISIYIGPSGLATYGQFSNFVGLVLSFSNGAINQGVVKYVAEYGNEPQKQRELFSTSFVITLVCSLISGLFLGVFSSQLSSLILKSYDFKNVFTIFGFTIILFSINSLLLSILNGMKELKKFVIVSIVGSLISLIFTTQLILFLGILGALYALVINQSIVFFVTLAYVLKSNWFKIEYFNKGITKSSFIKLAKYSAMAITSAITVPVSQMIVRNYIGENLSWEDAGYWQAIWYISSMYLMIVTTTLSIYYLPRLSEIVDKHELRKEILNGYKIVMPTVIFMALIIFFLKEFIVKIAFTDDFLPMIELFKWQMAGDVAKIASWLLGFLMLAKAMTRLFIYTQVFFSLSFTILSIVLVSNYGLIGVTYAYFINYLAYFVFLVFAIGKKL